MGRMSASDPFDGPQPLGARPDFRLLAPLAMDVFIFPSVFSMMARMVILYSENVLDGTKSVC